MLPETMTVIEAKGHGGPEVLVPGTRPVPVPAAGEVLIAVKAAGVNRPDVLQRLGLYPPPKGASDLLGLESRRARRGRRRLARRDSSSAMPCARWSMAAAMPSSAWRPKRRPCRCPAGLSHGRGRGAARDRVHRLAQCVRARRAEARRMAAGAWRRERHRHHRDPDRASARRQGDGDGGQRREGARLRGAGRRARHQLPQEDFVEAVRRRPAAMAPTSFSTWSAATISSAICAAAALEGRIVQIAFLKGSKVEVDLMRLMMRRLTLTGSTLRAQSTEAKARMARGDRGEASGR